MPKSQVKLKQVNINAGMLAVRNEKVTKTAVKRKVDVEALQEISCRNK